MHNISSHFFILLSFISQALALLGDYVDKEDSSVRIGAIMGLAIAYAGSQNDQVTDIFFSFLYYLLNVLRVHETLTCSLFRQIRSKLSPILNDAKAPLDVIAFASLSLGMIYVGSCNEEVAQSIIFALMDRSEAELGDALTRFLPLGLGLLYLGKQVGNVLYLVSIFIRKNGYLHFFDSINLFRYLPGKCRGYG